MPPSSLIVKLPFPASLLSRLQLTRQPNTASQASPPARLSPSTEIADHFSLSQLSLAIVISKSKPNGLSTEEYCKKLHKHIKQGGSVPIDQYQYIDTKQYWKEECDKIHKEKETLEIKIRCLEEAQRILKEKIGNREHFVEDGIGDLRARRVQEEERAHGRVEAGISRKRHAPSQDIFADQDGDNFWSDIDNDKHLQLSGQVLRIIRQRAQLEKSAQHAGTSDQINLLTKNILQAINLLETSILDCCLSLKLLRINGEERTLFLLQQLLHQVVLSFLACFNAMNRLFSTILGRGKQWEVVSRMVMFFGKSLDLLQTVSNLQWEEEIVQRNQNTRDKRARVEPVEYAVNKHLAHSLVQITMRVEWEIDQPGHSDTLEGMLYLIIDHTARLMSESVFGEHVATSVNPGNITTSRPEEGVLRPESRYMVQVLHAVLGGPNRKKLVMEVLSRNVSAGISSTSRSATERDMLLKVKKRLQSTLLKSMVGGPELESLKLPRLPTEISNFDDTRTKVEKYGYEWLQETVWGLIGWDLVT